MKIGSIIAASLLSLSVSSVHAGTNTVQPKLSFKFNDELPYIFRHAKRAKIHPALLMGIRYAEGNANYGIKPVGKNKRVYMRDAGYTMNGTNYLFANKLEKDISWAAITVSNSLARARSRNPLFELSQTYSPIGGRDDAGGLNKNWYSNVSHYYSKFYQELSPYTQTNQSVSSQQHVSSGALPRKH